jgi:hypothetical protein
MSKTFIAISVVYCFLVAAVIIAMVILFRGDAPFILVAASGLAIIAGLIFGLVRGTQWAGERDDLNSR